MLSPFRRGERRRVVDGVTGLVVPPRGPASLARAIVQLADDPGLRRRLGDAARMRYRGQFNPAWIGTRMMDIYDSMVRRPATASVAVAGV